MPLPRDFAEIIENAFDRARLESKGHVFSLESIDREIVLVRRIVLRVFGVLQLLDAVQEGLRQEYSVKLRRAAVAGALRIGYRRTVIAARSAARDRLGSRFCRW